MSKIQKLLNQRKALLESGEKLLSEMPGRPEVATSDNGASAEDDRNDKIVRYLPLIQKVIARLLYRFPPVIEAEDMMTVGVLGLIEAIERYEPGALSFQHYAEIRIRGAVLDELRRADTFSRGLRRKARRFREGVSRLEMRLGRAPTSAELARELEMSEAELEELRDQVQPVVFMDFEKLDYYNQEQVSWSSRAKQKKDEDPFVRMQRKEALERLRDAMERLPERQRLILFLYYFEEMTLREIGDLLNLSESRICQIHQKACKDLKISMPSHFTDLWE